MGMRIYDKAKFLRHIAQLDGEGAAANVASQLSLGKGTSQQSSRGEGCPMCGRIYCDHTPTERGQTEDEMNAISLGIPLEEYLKEKEKAASPKS